MNCAPRPNGSTARPAQAPQRSMDGHLISLTSIICILRCTGLASHLKGNCTFLTQSWSADIRLLDSNVCAGQQVAELRIAIMPHAAEKALWRSDPSLPGPRLLRLTNDQVA